MANKPLSNEAIALTEKKMDMSLDDIIKMSKTNDGKKKQRVLNKSRGIFNGNQDRSLKVRQYMDSRSTVRQGVLAQKRSKFQGNNFPLAAEAARKAAAFTFRNRPVNHRNAGNWNKPRPGAPLRRQGNASSGGKKQQKQHQQQHEHKHEHTLPRGETIQNQKPRTLDSLFANMKEQRMRTSIRPNNGPGTGFTARSGGAFNQPRQPWLRGRFGTYRN